MDGLDRAPGPTSPSSSRFRFRSIDSWMSSFPLGRSWLETANSCTCDATVVKAWLIQTMYLDVMKGQSDSGEARSTDYDNWDTLDWIEEFDKRTYAGSNQTAHPLVNYLHILSDPQFMPANSLREKFQTTYRPAGGMTDTEGAHANADPSAPRVRAWAEDRQDPQTCRGARERPTDVFDFLQEGSPHVTHEDLQRHGYVPYSYRPPAWSPAYYPSRIIYERVTVEPHPLAYDYNAYTYPYHYVRSPHGP